jgi:tRNA-uridine 2-sulfurtransferase
MSRVVLAMSGGVDSSAAAYLLREAGHEVIGLFMRSGENADVCATDLLPVLSSRPGHQGCCSAADAADARRVADRLDIPFHALNFRDEFTRIKDYFADEYTAGRTPNPCAMCNIWLKFGKLWDFARQVQADFIATGHYARITGGDDPTTLAAGSAGPQLRRGRDESKDQSYVLFGIRREILGRVLFPVGDRTKAEIRALAAEAGIQTANKPDSQEICFIPDNDYAGFLSRYREPVATAGEIVDTSGRVLGTHAGYERYTIGQRRGLGLAFGEPRFVVRIEPHSRRVVIGTREELGRRSLAANRVNWLVDPPAGEIRCTAQIRYQHAAAAAMVRRAGEDRLEVTFDEPQFGVAPGQAVVLYDGDLVLGGGWIESDAERSPAGRG